MRTSPVRHGRHLALLPGARSRIAETRSDTEKKKIQNKRKIDRNRKRDAVRERGGYRRVIYLHAAYTNVRSR